MKIHKGDTVKIMVGKDHGKSGKVLRIDGNAGVITIENLNMFKKHVRPRRQGEKGETISVARPINASNVMVLCPNCKNAVRVGYRFEGQSNSGQKVRFCKKCQSVL